MTTILKIIFVNVTDAVKKSTIGKMSLRIRTAGIMKCGDVDAVEKKAAATGQIVGKYIC